MCAMCDMKSKMRNKQPKRNWLTRLFKPAQSELRSNAKHRPINVEPGRSANQGKRSVRLQSA